MQELAGLLTQFGIGIGANAFYDIVKGAFASGRTTNEAVFETVQQQVPSLTIENARALADRAIEILARRGDIEIRGSYLYARDSIRMASSQGTKFTFGDGSTSKTDKTQIDAGHGARIEGQGGAEVRQNDDGSISFHT